jgi:WD40 repeat protein
VASIKLGARIRALAFSPNRQTFATGDDHGTVALWNADTRSPVWRSEHKQPVVIVEFAPDGEQLVAGGLDGGVWLLAAGDGKAQSWQGHVAAITSATFSPDRQRILTTSIDGSARVWLVATGVEVGIAVSPTTGVPLTSGAFLPDGTGFLVVGPAGAFKVAKNNRTSRVPGTGEGDMGNTPSFAVSPNGRSVAIGIADRIDVVDLTTGNTRPLRRRAAAVGQEIPAAATDLEFDRTGSVLLAAYDDGAAVIWDVELQQERAVFRVRRERLRFAKFSPDGRLVLTAGDALDAALWNVVQPSIPPNSPFDFLRQRATEAIPRNLTLADISPDRMRPR